MNISIEERVQQARDLFRQGYNCSQSVVMAFQDVLGLEPESLERLSLGLGGGVGRMREVCGAVSGMAVVAGSMIPTGTDHHSQKQAAYALIQELAGKFREQNGSIICRELMQIRADSIVSPVPEERSPQYYHTRPCEEMVACAVRLLAEKI